MKRFVRVHRGDEQFEANISDDARDGFDINWRTLVPDPRKRQIVSKTKRWSKARGWWFIPHSDAHDFLSCYSSPADRAWAVRDLLRMGWSHEAIRGVQCAIDEMVAHHAALHASLTHG